MGGIGMKIANSSLIESNYSERINTNCYCWMWYHR